MERDIVFKDYSAFVELPAVDAKFEKGAFTGPQLNRIAQMAAAGVPWADTALMLCYTGFRIAEFLQLTADSYHPEFGGYLQGGIKTKAGKERIVPVHPKIAEYLSVWMSKRGEAIICTDDGEPIRTDQYRTQFAKLAKAIGAPQATPHWCRHTMASRLKLAGADELTIRRILGHSDKDVTEHYTHIDVPFLRKQILLIP